MRWGDIDFLYMWLKLLIKKTCYKKKLIINIWKGSLLFLFSLISFKFTLAIAAPLIFYFPRTPYHTQRWFSLPLLCMATNNQNIGTKIIIKIHRSIYVTLRFHHIIKIKYKKLYLEISYVIRKWTPNIYFVEGIFFSYFTSIRLMQNGYYMDTCKMLN